MVDEVYHLLECCRVGLFEEDPLVLRVAQPGAEVWAGDGHKEAVARKFLPGTKNMLENVSQIFCMCEAEAVSLKSVSMKYFMDYL